MTPEIRFEPVHVTLSGVRVRWAGDCPLCGLTLRAATQALAAKGAAWHFLGHGRLDGSAVAVL